MKPYLLISACLMGVPCRYDGKSKPHPIAKLLEEKYRLIPICPEVEGGLPTPRTPCEILQNRVVSMSGEDRTKEYRLGANKALVLTKKYGITAALLKAKSPSCGNQLIYDGSFSGRLIDGMGITARLLSDHGILVYNETQANLLIDKK